MNYRMLVVLSTATVFAVAGCATPQPSAKPTPRPVAATKPTIRAAPPTRVSTTAPTPSPVAVKVPENQQAAQDGVNNYLQKTLDTLPKGTALDGTRYVDGPGTVGCDDARVRVQDARDVDAPADTDFSRLIATMGEQWQQWGWTVDDADDQGRATRLGHAPDGYDVQIEAAQDPKQRPSLVGWSPCFAAGLRENDIPRTPVLEQSPP